MSDDDGSDTKKRRRITQSEADDIYDSRTRADRSAQRDARVRDLELRLVEVIGVDGDGGEFAALKREATRLAERMEKMERHATEQALFASNLKVSIRWTVALASLIATATGALLLVAIERLLK